MNREKRKGAIATARSLYVNRQGKMGHLGDTVWVTFTQIVQSKSQSEECLILF